MHYKILFFCLLMLTNGMINAQDIGPHRKTIIEQVKSDNYAPIFVEQVVGRYFVLFYEEQMMMSLLKRDFQMFIKVVDESKKMILNPGKKEGNWLPESYIDLLIDSGHQKSYNFKDELTSLLRGKLMVQDQAIRHDLQNSDLKPEDKDFILFYMDHWNFSWYTPYDQHKKVELHFMAQRYNDNYPQSSTNRIVQTFHGLYTEPNWFGYELNMGITLNQKTSGIKTNLVGKAGFNMDFRFYVHSTFFGYRMSLEQYRFNNQLATHNQTFLHAGDTIFSGGHEFFMGRQFFINDFLRVSPFVGITRRKVSYKEHSDEEFSKLTNKGDALSTGFDLQIQFRRKPNIQTLMAKHPRKLSQQAYFLRLGVQYNHNPFRFITSELNGNNIQIVLGFGIMMRGTKEVLIDRNSYDLNRRP
jgi:hypothetical protein